MQEFSRAQEFPLKRKDFDKSNNSEKNARTLSKKQGFWSKTQKISGKRKTQESKKSNGYRRLRLTDKTVTTTDFNSC